MQSTSKLARSRRFQAHLEEIDSKLLQHADTLEQMQVKVNLSMESIGKVQEEQIRVSISLKGPRVTSRKMPTAGGRKISYRWQPGARQRYIRQW